MPKLLSSSRERAFRETVRKRQPNLTVILENVLDRHNVAAVLRTADSVGISEVFILYTEKEVTEIEVSKRASGGAKKWLDVHLYNDAAACFEHVRSKYEKVYATHLGKSAASIYELNLTESVALLFGNEHFGISEKTLQYADANMVVPQVGMSRSLNVSVACAITLYEAYRQRNEAGFYTENPLMDAKSQEALYQNYLNRSSTKGYNLYVKAYDKD